MERSELSVTKIAAPTPLISEARAREVRVKAFATAEHLLDVVDAQVSKLKEIADADLPIGEILETRGPGEAVKAIQKAMEHIPMMLEMAKEAANPLTKLVGILRSEAPIPGEPKAFGVGSGPEAPHEPESLDDVVGDYDAIRIHNPDSEPKKKPKRRKSKAG